MKFTLRAYMPAPDSAAGARFGRSGDPNFEALYALDQICFPPRIAYSRRVLRWFLWRPGAECVVAHASEGASPDPTDASSSLAGFILTETHAHEGHIVTLDVAPQFRRAGVGTALLEKMERSMASRGVACITLETATNNDPAVAFWQRHSYRAVGLLRGYYMGRADALSMLKCL